jgi:GT2 family glycosyltransferase
MSHEPKIDVRIPYEPEGRLGWDYNRIMEETPHDWVLLLDHDVLLLNPNWYHICQQASQLGASLITCKTNAPHPKTGQCDKKAPKTDSVGEHQVYAKQVWDRFGMSATPVSLVSGFFMLVHKPAWRQCGGFPGVKMFGEDWGFSERLIAHGKTLLRLDGLYVYHMRKRVGTWVDEVESTREVRFREKGKW